MDSAVEVVCVGHAIVDVLSPSDDTLVASLGLEKGTMTLVDEEQSEKIYAALGSASEASGGSAANTAACLASLGASVRFVGRVRDDTLGEVFTHDIRAMGVHFDVPPATWGPGTGRSMVMVTPDAEKTMCTNLGAGALLETSDIDLAGIAAARVLYIEGYLCGDSDAAPAVDRAVAAARDAGTLVAFSGSDPAWVDLQGDALRAMVARSDILFANEKEALGLAEVSDLDVALRVLVQRCPTVAVTRGPKGCIVSSSGETVTVPAVPVDRVVDTTGAGDSFAAGFLYGVVTGRQPEVSARLGAIAAAEIVSHMGARPLAHLADLVRSAGTI
jgi:sugar/nucleoside kinase (ribokinase family)